MTIGVARSADPGTLGLDTLQLLSVPQLQAAYQKGFKFIGGYLEVMTAAYVQNIFAANLGILLITEARVVPLDATQGMVSAHVETARLKTLDCPQGVNATIDLEATQGTATDVLSYLNTFASGLGKAGFPDIVYVAQPNILTGEQLYSDSSTHLYWSGASANPDLPCGYSIFQGLPTNYKPDWGLGAQIDLDVIFQDRKGRVPTLWWPR